MKFPKTAFFSAAFFALLVMSLNRSAQASPTNAAPSSPTPAATPSSASLDAQTGAIVASINAKIKAGQDSESALAGDLKQFDALIAAHKGEKSDAVAKIVFLKATLYAEVLSQPEKAVTILKQLTVDYPGTQAAKAAAMIVADADGGSDLAVGDKFPGFDVKSVDGKPLSPDSQKGKVTLIDFWATWCGPCRAELPNVVQTYAKYHDKGFAIVGVSLDESASSLASYTKSNDMTWPQYFDGKGWQNDLAVKYGVHAIPCTYLLNSKGIIIGKNLRGPALEKAVAAAVANNV